MSLNFKRTLLTLGTLVFTCLFMFTAQAGTINDTLDLNSADPDIYSNQVSVNYVQTGATTFTLTAQGAAVKLTDGGSEFLLDAPGTFDLTAFIDTSTDSATGTLSILGTIASLGYNGGTLLTGDLNQIGGPTQLNALVDVTGGDAAGLFGDTAGVILSLFTGYTSPTSFNAAFNGLPNFSQANTFAKSVPVPYTLPLFLLGLGILAMRSKPRV